LKKITIITKPNCAPCTKWKNVMKAIGVEFKEISIRELSDSVSPDKNMKIAKFYVAHRKAMPVILVGHTPKYAGDPGTVHKIKKMLKEWGAK